MRVAVLGGGMAGLTAAFELTATPELRERYEVDVYTIGWRLGGKGASGRNADRDNRIEEHGLHVWFGFYENAFELIRRAYAELGPPWSVEACFEPCSDIALGEPRGREWCFHRFQTPVRPGQPGVDQRPVEFWEALDVLLQWVLERHSRAPGVLHELAGALARLPGLGVASKAARTVLDHWSGAAADGLLRAHVERILAPGDGGLRDAPAVARRLSAARAQGSRPLGPEPHTPIVTQLLRRYREWLWRKVVEPALDDDELRLLFYAVDILAAALTGIVKEDLVERGFDPINDRDLRAWLGEYGAHELTLRHAPFLQAYYDLAFAYRGGDPARPALAAGKALQTMVRLVVGYQGAFFYKLASGMGEIVFAPLYEVLAARGVRFHFFHRVTSLRVDPDLRVVTGIEMQPQVKLRAADYAPLVAGAWPSAPRWEQLEDGEAVRASGADLEHDDGPDPPDSITVTGFHRVVLALSAAPLKDVCIDVGEAVPRFQRMLDATDTVATQSLQLWMTRRAEALGWPWARDAILTAYAQPLSTYAAMDQLLAAEPRSVTSGVAHIAYLCGVLPDAGEPRDSAAAARSVSAAASDARRLVGSELGRILPRGRGPVGFDWDVLAAPAGVAGEARLAYQYSRVNDRGSERYVSTFPGPVEHRLRPDESGVENLVLAGDWTRNGIDGGCMEAAVASGRLAARAISGFPESVPGTTGWLASDGWSQPSGRYVEYGGLISIPSPYRSEGATLHGFWAEADRGKLDALCRRVFAEPSGGAVQFRPLTSGVMLTWGAIASVRSLDPAFSDWGSVQENQVAIWIPVVRVGRDEHGRRVAARLAMFVPFIWLDAPMSLATGREVMGFAKTWGTPSFPPAGSPGSFGLAAFGLARRGDQAAMHPLLEVTGDGAMVNAAEELRSLEELVVHAAHGLGFEDALELGADMLADVAAHRLRSVFLKQFRAVEGASGAALQQITESSYIVRRITAEPLAGPYRLTVHPMFSQPLGRELGLASQTLALAYRCEMDFDVRDSRVLWAS